MKDIKRDKIRSLLLGSDIIDDDLEEVLLQTAKSNDEESNLLTKNITEKNKEG